LVSNGGTKKRKNRRRGAAAEKSKLSTHRGGMNSTCLGKGKKETIRRKGGICGQDNPELVGEDKRGGKSDAKDLQIEVNFLGEGC